MYPDLGPVFYLDVWPFSNPVLVITSASFGRQLTDAQLHKDKSFCDFMDAFTEKMDLVCMEGQDWKKWKAVFSPGFQSSHIMDLVPNIIQDIELFRTKLRAQSETGKVFSLEDMSTKLTVDVIGRVALNVSLDTQRRPHELASALVSQINWNVDQNQFNPLVLLNPFRPFVLRYNTYRMNRYLDDRLKLLGKSKETKLEKGRSIIELALHSYQATNASKGDSSTGIGAGADSTFLRVARSQVKLFLFAGHDTTAGTICYAIYLLSKNTTALSKLRQEHDEVLDHPENTPAQFSENPHLVNRLPYTAAVIKEALRLYPPASLIRAGRPDFQLRDPTNNTAYPTQGVMVWSVHRSIQRDPSCWKRAAEFIPERWLVAKDDPLFPPIENFRAFERGPRSCIGQEIANTEMKLTLALTAREFNFTSVYKELDQGKKGIWTVNGELAYQVPKGSAHPRDGMPMRVKFRSKQV